MKARKEEETGNEKFQKAIHKYFGLAFAFAILMLALRIFELLLMAFNSHLFNNSSSIITSAILYDDFFISKLVLFYLPFFLLFWFVNEKLALIFTKIILTFFILIYLGLILYFNNSLIPLGADFYAYSILEIKNNVNAGGGFTFFQVFPFVFILPFCIFLNLIFDRQRISNWLFLAFFIPAILSFFSSIASRPDSSMYKIDFEYYMVINKMDYFTHKSFEYLYFKEKH